MINLALSVAQYMSVAVSTGIVYYSMRYQYSPSIAEESLFLPILVRSLHFEVGLLRY